ncbi:MAG: chemotaxis protein CheC [Denitrovibrio sp.]|nr:MAG: chemotaxis protein CheC [Denitrovibrio sp.]
MSDNVNFFNDEETDALQELMNIAFGQAAAELAEVIDISVTLSFPKLNIVKVSDLMNHIADDVKYINKCNLVEQRYKGDTGGVAYLIFPHGTEKEFVSMFHMDEEDNDHEVFIDVEREVLSEVGNILIGACISKIFDLLKTNVTYTPPHTMIGHKFENHFLKGCFTGEDYAIMLNTGFSLSEKTIEGYLFLVNCQSSIEPLKKALADLFESYE